MKTRSKPTSFRHFLTLASVIAFAGSLQAQDKPVSAAPVPRIPLWPEGSIQAGAESESDPAIPTVDIHLPEAGKATGCGVVVLPGGGYGGVSMEYEGVNSVKFLTSNGIAAFVVRYRHAPRYRFPLPLDDAKRAIQLVRFRAADFHIDPQRLGLMGYSAGGHLASMVITRLDSANASAPDPVARESARPDFAFLVYPVITFVEEAMGHKGSRSNLTADKKELWRELSSELHVSKDTPPVFLIHGGLDTTVPPENSMLFADACRKAGVSVELHVLSQGEHGFMADDLRAEAYDCMLRWLGRNGWMSGRSAMPSR